MKRALIHADGASSGNPGPAGIGAVVEVEGGHTVEIFEYIGHATNNVAEYTALIRALECAIKHEADTLEIRLDSELLVKQIKGQYRVKHEAMKPLYAQAMALLKKTRRFTISHIPRELNSRADALSKRGVEARNTPSKPMTVTIIAASGSEVVTAPAEPKTVTKTETVMNIQPKDQTGFQF